MAFDIAGKGVVLPLAIVFNNFSKEPREQKVYSAIKNPVTAVIQLGIQVPVFYAIWNGVGKLANRGLLDRDPNYSFNAEFYANKFAGSIEHVEGIGKLKAELRKKGLTKRLANSFDEIVSGMDNPLVKQSFKKFQEVDKRLFHLKSRFAFAGLLLSIPLVCAIENKCHPRLMNFIKKVKDGHK
jgi:hypothetical protein